MNDIVRSSLVLLIISAVCVTALAYINEITTEPIRIQAETTENNAYKVLFSDAEEFKKDELSAPEGGIITGITTVYKGGAPCGNIVRISQKGYGGAINMMVGIKDDGTVTGIKVLSHSETPGLGAYCDKDTFMDKFAGRSKFPLVVIKSGTPGENEIDAITSATITTKAVTDAVNTAYEWAANEGGAK